MRRGEEAEDALAQCRELRHASGTPASPVLAGVQPKRGAEHDLPLVEPEPVLLGGVLSVGVAAGHSGHVPRPLVTRRRHAAEVRRRGPHCFLTCSSLIF